MLIGLVFIIMGCLLLLKEIGIITGGFWGYFWPVVLILLGLSMVTKNQGDCWCCGILKTRRGHRRDRETDVK